MVGTLYYRPTGGEFNSCIGQKVCLKIPAALEPFANYDLTIYILSGKTSGEGLTCSNTYTGLQIDNHSFIHSQNGSTKHSRSLLTIHRSIYSVHLT